MKTTKPVAPITLELTAEQRHGLLALLYSGVTNGALNAMHLDGLTEILNGGDYDGPWEYNGKPRVPTLETFNCTNDSHNIRQL